MVEIINIIASVGNGISWLVGKATEGLANLIGTPLTDLQSKLISLLIFGIVIYFLFSVISINKKFLNWGLIVLACLLFISIVISVFV
jgi:hypothetical protein